MKKAGRCLHSVPPESTISRAKVSSSDQDSWDHIQDAGLRKKVQNRIAQRTYRERIKKRIEALEQFRDASTAVISETTVADRSSQEAENLGQSTRRDSCGMMSPAGTSPSSCFSGSLQTEDDNCVSIMTVPTLQGEGKSTSPCQTLIHPNTSMVTPSPDMAFSFESLMQDSNCTVQDDPSDNPIWDFPEAIGTENNVTGFEKAVDFEDNAVLERPCCGCSHSELTPSNTKSILEPNLSNNSHDDKTALHIAAENGHQSTVRFLLGLRPEIIAQDRVGRTALHLAIYHKHQRVVQEFLKIPTNLEIRDHSGQTALHAAVSTGQDQAVADLLAAGADPESRDSTHRTSLHLAASKGLDTILKLLVDGGADVNTKIR